MPVEARKTVIVLDSNTENCAYTITNSYSKTLFVTERKFLHFTFKIFCSSPVVNSGQTMLTELDYNHSLSPGNHLKQSSLTHRIVIVTNLWFEGMLP